MTKKNEVGTVAELTSGIPTGRDVVHQLLGQSQAFKAAGNLLRTFGVSKLAVVKENKLYRQLAGTFTPNGTELKGTWEEFCGLLNTSVDKADEDIKNLREFGEEAMEQMQSVGIGYRDLRQMRRLPTDEKVALIEAAKDGDKETLIDLAETLIARTQKEKEAATNEITALIAQRDGYKTAAQDAARSAAALNKTKRLSDFTAKTQAVRDETLVQQGQIVFSATALKRMWDDALGEGLDPTERAARTEFIWFAAHAATARMCELLGDMRENAPDGTATEATMAHALTLNEAQHWANEWATIEAHLKAEHLVRHERRRQDNAQDVGRPAAAPLAGVKPAGKARKG